MIHSQSKPDPAGTTQASRRRPLPQILSFLLLVGAISAHAQILIFSEDFEGPFPGAGDWAVVDSNPAGTEAYWGAVDLAFGGEGTHSGNFKGYCAGVGFDGTSANPKYRNAMTSVMTRTIDLAGFSSATLTFWFRLPSLEACCDLPRVYVDTTEVWSTNQTVSSWTQVSVSLNDFVGAARSLSFEFKSDSLFTFEGWYLDDIRLTGAGGATAPPNDPFGFAYVLEGDTGTTNATNLNASKETGEPDHAGSAGGRSVWFRWTPQANGAATMETIGSSFDTLLAVYTGNDLTNLTLVAENDDADDGVSQSRVTFQARSNIIYSIAVDGFERQSGTIRLSWSLNSTPPPNDSFANPRLLAGATGVTNGSNLNATRQAGEPDHAGNAGGSSVWYRWQAPNTSLVTFNTLESSLDTLLAVYRGTSVSALTLVASNDDASENFAQSQVTFAATATTAYYIAIDGYDGAQDDFILAWIQGAPANDAFASALALGAMTGSVSGHNFNATPEPGEPDHLGMPATSSVWYQWTAPSNSPVRFRVTSDFAEVRLAIYAGATLQALVPVAFNAFPDLFPQDRLNFPAVANATYVIAIESADGTQWNFDLDWQAQTAPQLGVSPLPPEPELSVTVHGAPGDIYRVEQSADLATWTPWTVVTNLTGSVEVRDVSAPATPHRSFRAVLAP